MLTCILGGLIKNWGQQESHDGGTDQEEAHHGGCVPFLLVTEQLERRWLLCLVLSVIPLCCMVGLWPDHCYLIHQRGKFHFNIAGYNKIASVAQCLAHSRTDWMKIPTDYCLIPVECLKHSVCWTIQSHDI